VLTYLRTVFAITLAVALASPFVKAEPAAPQAQSGNVSKEITDRKDAVQWRNAPDNVIPPEVCTMFQACNGMTKFVTLPPATEGGKKVGRALFWTPASAKQKMDVFIMEHQTYSDVYFFLVTPDGSLAKTAYKAPGKGWVPMGSGLAQPTFEKSKQAWHAWITKLGSGAPKPAAAPPAAPNQ